MGEMLSLLNVLLVPILVYVFRIEHRLTKVEGMRDRLELLEKLVFNRGS